MKIFLICWVTKVWRRKWSSQMKSRFQVWRKKTDLSRKRNYVSIFLAWNFFIYCSQFFKTGKGKLFRCNQKRTVFKIKILESYFYYENFSFASFCMCTKVWSSLGQSFASPQLRNVHAEIAVARYFIWKNSSFLAAKKNQ